MKFQPKKYTRKIPREVLINDVKAVARKLRKNTVTTQDYLEHGTYHPSTFRYKFGGWLPTLQQAGLQPSRSSLNISEEQLLKNLENIWDMLGKQPTATQLRIKSVVQSQYNYSTYHKHFGSWRNALQKFIKYQRSKLGAEGGEIQRQVKLGRRIELKNKNSRRRYVPLDLKFSVFLRDGFRCVCCGRTPLTEPGIKLHCDHIRCWSRGGKTVIDNLQTLCSRCNLGKGSKLISSP